MLEVNNSHCKIIFYDKYLKYVKNDEETLVQFSEIQKIKFSSSTFKIVLKNKDILKIKTTTKENRKIKELLLAEPDTVDKIKNKNTTESDIYILIKFNEDYFYVKLSNLTINSLKHAIIKRISYHFYPAIGYGNIKMDAFSSFEYHVINNDKSVQLILDEDLIAAVGFNKGILEIEVTVE